MCRWCHSEGGSKTDTASEHGEDWSERGIQIKDKLTCQIPPFREYECSSLCHKEVSFSVSAKCPFFFFYGSRDKTNYCIFAMIAMMAKECFVLLNNLHALYILRPRSTCVKKL